MLTFLFTYCSPALLASSLVDHGSLVLPSSVGVGCRPPSPVPSDPSPRRHGNKIRQWRETWARPAGGGGRAASGPQRQLAGGGGFGRSSSGGVRQPSYGEGLVAAEEEYRGLLSMAGKADGRGGGASSGNHIGCYHGGWPI